MDGVGYVLYTYRNPEQISALTNELLTAASTVAVTIHHDAKSEPLEPFSTDPRVYVLEDPIEVRWAHWSQVEAIVKTADRMLCNHPEIDWIVLLTGQDWPVVPIEQIAPTLSRGGFDAYIDVRTAEENWGWDADRRYGHRWFSIPKSLVKRTPFLERLGRIPGVQYLPFYGTTEVQLLGVRYRRVRTGTLFGGSEYFMMNRLAWGAVQVEYSSFRRRRRFTHSLVPTEVFFGTAIVTKGLKAGSNRRYMRFLVGQPNPEPLEASDASAAVEQGCLFARKVEPGDEGGFVAEIGRLLAGEH